ncbi:unnamed protein product, partial [Prorocentrum cordatum]
FREKHFGYMKGVYPRYLTDQVTGAFHRVGVNYKITFNSETVAADFQDQFNRAGHMWTDPRDHTKHPLRARGDLPIYVRTRRRAFSVIYTEVKDLLASPPRWNPTFRLVVNGYKGVLQ